LRAILHIGFPKTGTSSIQNYCSQAYAELQAEGILFPKAGRILSFKDRRRHMGLSFACQPLDLPPTTMMKIHEVTSTFSRKLYRKRFFNRLTHELHKCGHSKIALFSAEELSTDTNDAMIRAIKNDLGALFNTVTVFNVIREPCAYLSSTYTQHVKIGGTQSWEAFRDYNLEAGLYLPALQRWATQFDPASISTRVMQNDALSLLEMELGTKIPNIPLERKNVSMSELGVEVLRQVNLKYAIACKKRPKNVRTTFAAHMQGPSWKVPAADIDLIYNAFSTEIDAIKQISTMDVADLNYIDEFWTADHVKESYAVRPDIFEAGREGLAETLFNISASRWLETKRSTRTTH
jgi:hypothetical protein